MQNAIDMSTRIALRTRSFGTHDSKKRMKNILILERRSFLTSNVTTKNYKARVSRHVPLDDPRNFYGNLKRRKVHAIHKNNLK